MFHFGEPGQDHAYRSSCPREQEQAEADRQLITLGGVDRPLRREVDGQLLIRPSAITYWRNWKDASAAYLNALRAGIPLDEVLPGAGEEVRREEERAERIRHQQAHIEQLREDARRMGIRPPRIL